MSGQIKDPNALDLLSTLQGFMPEAGGSAEAKARSLVQNERALADFSRVVTALDVWASA